jgi:hypothetical protein
VIVSKQSTTDTPEKAAASVRRPKGDGTAWWMANRQRWRVRVLVPANADTAWDKPHPVSRDVKDPAKYRGNWPSAMGRELAEQVLTELRAEVAAGLHNRRLKP